METNYSIYHNLETNLHYCYHISGSFFLLFNISVCLLIFYDSDKKSNDYRKYLLWLQFCSTMSDLYFNMHCVIALASDLIFYCSGFVPFNMNMVDLFASHLFLIMQILNAYFYCVYFRTVTINPVGHRWCLQGIRRCLLYVFMQIWGVFIICMVHRALPLMLMNQTDIPGKCKWVTNKQAYLYLRFGTIGDYFMILAFVSSEGIVFVIIAFLVFNAHSELKSGMKLASETTKRYQLRAIRSLTLQIVIPTSIWLIPTVIVLGFYIYGVYDTGEKCAAAHWLNTLSASLFLIFPSRTFFHSLTILGCSPSYRHTIVRMFNLMINRISTLRYNRTINVIRLVYFPPKLSSTPNNNLYFYHDNYQVFPYFINSVPVSEERITLILHTSFHEFIPEFLATQIDNWNGPIAIGIYFDRFLQTQTDMLSKIQYTFDQLKDQSLRDMVAVHLICNTLKDPINPNALSAAYPINVVRNIARQFTTTRYLLIGDMDHLFSEGFEEKMRKLASSQLKLGEKRALVYRIFEIDEKESKRRGHTLNKSELRQLLHQNKAVVFHKKINLTDGHSIPYLKEWLKTEEKAETGIFKANVPYNSSSWEPQIVFARDAPKHDELFPYRLRNNVVLRWEMCRAGYKFDLVDDLFVYHTGIETFGSVSFKKKYKIRSINMKRFHKILDIFKRRMNLMYPDTENTCPEFK